MEEQLNSVPPKLSEFTKSGLFARTSPAETMIPVYLCRCRFQIPDKQPEKSSREYNEFGYIFYWNSRFCPPIFVCDHGHVSFRWLERVMVPGPGLQSRGSRQRASKPNLGTSHEVRMFLQIYAAFNSNWVSYESRHVTSSWILLSITRSPLILLTLSFATFSVGIILFAYSSQQVRYFVLLLSMDAYQLIAYVL